MDELKRDDMLRYFEEVNAHLANADRHGEILIAGGAALTLAFSARNSTYDIDAIFEPKEDMRKIIKDVAQANNLDDDWLNDAVKGFMTDKMKFSPFLEYSHLTVSRKADKSTQYFSDFPVSVTQKYCKCIVPVSVYWGQFATRPCGFP